MTSSSKTIRRQWHILLELSERPRTVGMLAKRYGVSKATAQRDVNVLASVFVVRAMVDELRHRQTRYYKATLPIGGAS